MGNRPFPLKQYTANNELLFFVLKIGGCSPLTRKDSNLQWTLTSFHEFQNLGGIVIIYENLSLSVRVVFVNSESLEDKGSYRGLFTSSRKENIGPPGSFQRGNIGKTQLCVKGQSHPSSEDAAFVERIYTSRKGM